MHGVTAKEWELLSFFEVEPDLLFPGESWDCNDAAYRVVREDLSLSVAIAPFHRDVRIILEHGHRCVYELNAVGVVDVRYRQGQGAETLEVELTERDVIVLRVKPHITLEQRVRSPE